MDRKELEAKIIEMVATSYNKDVSELSVNTNIKEELGGASTQMVGLVSEIESKLDVMVQLQIAGQMIIGLKPGINTISSIGICDIPGFEGSEGSLLAVGDSAVCTNPNAE